MAAVENICGKSYINAYRKPTWAYGLVKHNCYQQGTPGHEIAHMYGAAHDREHTSFVPDDGAAYGYWIPDSDYRTIMA